MHLQFRPASFKTHVRHALGALLVATLTACGGGGGGSPTASTTPAAFTLVVGETTQSLPVGPQIDLLAGGFFPLDDGARWNYALLDANGNSAGTSVVTLSNTAAGSGTRLLRYTQTEGGTSTTDDYLWKSDGLYASLAGLGLPQDLVTAFGEMRLYAFPSFAEGETRIVTRSGTWGADVDGDGQRDAFRVEYRQRHAGQVPLALPWDAAATAVRLVMTLELRIQPSGGAKATGVLVSIEEHYASGVGLVRSSERVTDLNGAQLGEARTAMIHSASVGGRSYQPVVGGATSWTYMLPHAALVFDSARNVFYASIPAGAIQGASTIATIIPSSGSVTYSAPLDAPPDAMAISADGSVLHVGLREKSQVLSLSLPTMTEIGRVTLAADPFFGVVGAESLAVSPTDPRTVAVSRAAWNVSPRHQGVALLKAGSFLPVTTQGHTGSNLVTFGADANSLFGLNTETTEFGLRRITAAADGLREAAVVASNADFSTRQLVYSAGQVFVGNHVWRASDLSDQGVLAPGSSVCVPTATVLRAVCAPTLGSANSLTVWSTGTFSQLSTVDLGDVGSATVTRMVPGRAGTLAVSLGADRLRVLTNVPGL